MALDLFGVTPAGEYIASQQSRIGVRLYNNRFLPFVHKYDD